MVAIAPMKNEDERFLALVGRIASTTIRDLRPTDVFVTRIDHWFDHKWLGFSGKGLLGRHSKRLTIPPIMPDRVLSHRAYSFDAVAGSYQIARVPPLHRYQQSSQNLTRFI